MGYEAVTPQAASSVQGAGALLELLEREALALQAGDATALKAVCLDKLGYLRQLETLLAALKTPAGAALPDEQRRSLAELLRQCQQRSKANEALLNLRFNRARNALLAQRGPPSNYDARGGGSYETLRQLRSVA
ncbi:MAG: hypothetical protein OSA97_00430 [Nevskia sp.]|nr:hypothetical protein [Nevskia sp.]